MRVTWLLFLLAVGAVAADLEPSQMKQDLEVLRAALYEAHGGLERYSSRAEHDKRFEHARSLVAQPMPVRSFIGIVSEVLAGVRDGHMRLEYDAQTNAALAEARLLPLRVANEGERLIVTQENAQILPGMQLVSVNGRRIEEIRKAILPKLSGDGFIESGKARSMARDLARNYWLFVDQSETFTVEAKGADGRVVSARLEGVKRAGQSGAAPEAVSLSFPEGGKVALLRVRMFGGDTFVSSLATAFASAREKGVGTLILDLRGNGGGVDEYGASLVSHFVSKPFRYFDHIRLATIRPSFATWKPKTFEDLSSGTKPAPDGGYLVLPQLHSGVAEQKPAPAPFLGKVVVLIDGGTFSTAADVAAQLRSLTQATFIGEETGGGYEGNTSGLNALIALPHSGLKLKIQMYGYWNAVRAAKHGRGTLPDIPIVTVLAGRDVALERAFAVARSR